MKMNSNHTDTVTSYFTTHIMLYTYKFQWNIENFSGLFKPFNLKGPVCQLIPNQEWCIGLIYDTDPYLILKCEDIQKVNIVADTSFMDIEKKILFSERRKFSCKNEEVSHVLVPNLTSTKWNEINDLPKDILIITSRIKVYLPAQNAVNVVNLKSEDKHKTLEIAAHDLKKMYNESNLTDTILFVRGVSIKAHKTVLCARSPVFARMFNHNFQEKENNTIIIDDIDAETMKKFIELLYCPILDDDIDIDTACNFYYAADKYEVLSIRHILGTFLLNQLTIDNCLRLLAFADLHKDFGMKTKVEKFLKFHINTITEDTWQEFVVNNSKLASSLIFNYFSGGKI